MKEKVYIGIDTSNYTTSLAIIGEKSGLLANLKQPLPVKAGERGLRQSDAVFAHTVNMPLLMEKAKEILADKTPVCIGVSSKPRNESGSYMPCFLVGCAVAESLSAFLSVPLYKFSHQCGHIMAAIYSSGRYDIMDSTFGAFHVSGGTTELVRASFADNEFRTEIVGGTSDLNAGQVIDRIGVYLGLQFPAGAALEKLALENDKKLPRKRISASSTYVNLSGLENLSIKLYGETGDKSLVAAFVFDYIGRSIIEMISAYEARYGSSNFVFAGGVMCNSIIKRMINQGRNDAFAEPALSADNAVGIAVLAMRKYMSER